MAILINQNVVMKDLWNKVNEFSGNVHAYPNFSILPLKAFSEPDHISESDQPAKNTECLGAWFNAEIGSDLDSELFQKTSLSLPLLNIDVEDFNDGRAFTLAKLIRTRFNYTGELRLSGNFLVEQIAMFKACGVDAFLLPDDSDVDYALYILSNTPLSAY